MNRWKVFVTGSNFLVRRDGAKREERFGFTTTVFVEAENRKRAELAALAFLKDDPELFDGVLNAEDDPPEITVMDICATATFAGCALPRTRICFHPERRRR